MLLCDCMWMCMYVFVCVYAYVPEGTICSPAWAQPPVLNNHVFTFWAGEPRWKVTSWQAPKALDSWQLWLPNGLCQLLQGCAPCPGCHPWGAAPSTAAGEHLAAPQSPAAPEAAAVCFPAGCSAGGFQVTPFSWGNGFCLLGFGCVHCYIGVICAEEWDMRTGASLLTTIACTCRLLITALSYEVDTWGTVQLAPENLCLLLSKTAQSQLYLFGK